MKVDDFIDAYFKFHWNHLTNLNYYFSLVSIACAKYADSKIWDY